MSELVMRIARKVFLTLADEAEALRVERIPPVSNNRLGVNPRWGWGFWTIILALAAVWLIAAPAPARAATVLVRLDPGNVSGGICYKKVDSFKERRMTKVIAQTEDFSCGAGALATLLHYYFGRTINERDAIVGMFKSGQQEEIRKRGFSLLDMKRYCLDLKFGAEGYKIEDVRKLLAIKIPVIALLDTRQYKHFVVIRSANDKFVYLADPSFGNRKMALEDFNVAWNHVILVVTGTVDGTPEGLFAKDYELTLPKDQVTGIAYGNYWRQVAMDPSFSLMTNTMRNVAPLSGFFTFH